MKRQKKAKTPRSAIVIGHLIALKCSNSATLIIVIIIKNQEAMIVRKSPLPSDYEHLQLHCWGDFGTIIPIIII